MTIYVNVNAKHDGNGTKELPFRRINEAAKIAKPGDEILVAPGVYRENVNPINAGTEENRITYKSVSPLGAVITGAEKLTGWKKYKDDVWCAKVKNGIFGDYNPYKTIVYGDWYFAVPNKHTGCVWLNDEALYEVQSVDECLEAKIYECSWEPEKSRKKWFAEQDKENDETVYLQTTHGTPYKRMGEDIETNSKKINKGRVLVESDTWNYLLSPNDFSKDVFKRAFKYDGTIINKGYPANDIFYQNNEKKMEELRKSLNILKDKKIILYAPTYRDYEEDSEKQKMFNLLMDFKDFYKNLSEDYVLIVRLHYILSKDLEIEDEMKDFIIDLSNYNDIADLYLISDILITDYSSVFFDYAHSKKPILFFVPDIETYSEFRGLYAEVQENLPGPEIYTNQDLIDSIKNIDNISEEYKGKYEIFYEKFCNLGHGTSAKDVVDIVFKDVKK